MTSLKTKNICFLAAFLFLAIVPTLAKVVKEVKDCNQFLYQGTPPEIPDILEGGKIPDNNRYKVICQTYEDGPNPNPNSNQRYLTVYDTKNRIPVFSAYEYKEKEGSEKLKKDGVPWKIEPQLDEAHTQNNGNMKEEDSNTDYNNQAVNADYTKNDRRYDRGHLFPASHASSQEQLDSTFTLTNAVPQVDTFNQRRWSIMEQCMKCILDYNIKRDKGCFVVVGAQPSDNNNLNNRVNIPSMMWSAFYCANGVSGAYWSKNDADDTVHEGSLEDLKNNALTKGIDVFPGQPYVNYLKDIFAAMGRLITG
ncbi:Endonuclease domain-containing 1 protein [Larimichthys crocea]|uniref:Endonuclease domain-containing 1 protein n=1 Tax=Larimichthys crocea TaxID=215358 RepID=A0A6G0HJW2_LARCR|nr:Endonuclease domain-containing 1 protein [Larimichthys crocea]